MRIDVVLPDAVGPEEPVHPTDRDVEVEALHRDRRDRAGCGRSCAGRAC